MNSSVWGPDMHRALFFIAAGYDLNETPKHIKDQQYANFFQTVGDVLPCRYCRDSYRGFFEQLNISRYMQMPSCGLIKFYYDLRTLINRKLWTQEDKALKNAFEELQRTMPIDHPDFWARFREKAQKICYTKPPPPFENVVADLYKHRAGCSAHMKACRTPLPPMPFPQIRAVPFPDPNTSNRSDKEIYSGGRAAASRRKRKRTKSRGRVRAKPRLRAASRR